MMYLLAYAITNLSSFFGAHCACAIDANSPLENGRYFEGDMLIEKGTPLSAIVEEKRRWPGYPGGGKIPYIIDKSLNADAKQIEEAMKQYNDNTCIKFVRRTKETKYLRIFKGNGCYATAGYSGVKGQHLSLGNGCMDIGTILHELAHTIGFGHEHNRSDRDKYLNVYMENVEPGAESSFEKWEPGKDLLLNAFDYESITIYDNYAFSKNGNMTIEAKNGKRLTDSWAKKGLNKSDIERVNKLYKCT